MLLLFQLKRKIGDPQRELWKMNDCAIRLPNEDNKWLSFDNHCRRSASCSSFMALHWRKQIRISYVSMADFTREDW